MKSQIDFENYLQEKHTELHPEILDDYLIDAFEDWLSNLDHNDLIGYANEWGKKIALATAERLRAEEKYSEQDTHQFSYIKEAIDTGYNAKVFEINNLINQIKKELSE